MNTNRRKRHYTAKFDQPANRKLLRILKCPRCVRACLCVYDCCLYACVFICCIHPVGILLRIFTTHLNIPQLNKKAPPSNHCIPMHINGNSSYIRPKMLTMLRICIVYVFYFFSHLFYFPFFTHIFRHQVDSG